MKHVPGWWRRVGTQRRPLRWLLLWTLVFLGHVSYRPLAVAQQEPGRVGDRPGRRTTTQLPLIHLQDLDDAAVPLPAASPPASSLFPLPATPEQGGGSDPQNPYAALRLAAAPFARPGGSATYHLTLANTESVTRTYAVTATLPVQLHYVPGSAPDLSYDPAGHTLSWQGQLPPGHLALLIEESSLPLPYLDLGALGVPNLCAEFIAVGEDCDTASVTFNLGVNGYTANLYGEPFHQLTVSVDGLVLGHDDPPGGHNQWLPQPAAPGPLLAGLWRDVDMTHQGRWHAAIVSGLIAGHELFYVQWHDAPQAGLPNLTTRHAVAMVLNDTGALSGQAFYIYNNVSDPAQLVEAGYTIGVADKLGGRGMTRAYAPCCGDDPPPQGYPPPAGTTLQLRPVLLEAGNDYQRTFSYRVTVQAAVPAQIIHTATATSSSPDPALAQVWTTHYLAVRWPNYLPRLLAPQEMP